jgi:hypothetical protein
MEQWGFTTPKTRTHPTSHPTLMSHMVWNRIRAKPGIQDVKGQEVTFLDGSKETFDTIIAGTGYSVSLPFLAPALRPMDGHRVKLYLRVVHPTQTGLYFTGLFNVAGGGNIRMMDDQAEWVTELICGDQTLPDMAQMNLSMDEEQKYLTKHFPGSTRYALELDPIFYRKQIAKQRLQGRAHAASNATSNLNKAGA